VCVYVWYTYSLLKTPEIGKVNNVRILMGAVKTSALRGSFVTMAWCSFSRELRRKSPDVKDICEYIQ
jgi:hypothetical protein